MNSRVSYATVSCIESDGATAPSPAPRQGRFKTSRFLIWSFVSLVVWGAAMCLFRIWFQYSIILPIQGFVHAPIIEVFVLAWLFRLMRIERQERALFTDGIPVLATVTFVGIIRAPGTNEFCIGVRWSFVVDGMEFSGKTPRKELPNVAVGDEIWVLYQENNPSYAHRWALFDEDGNMRHRDTMPWSIEEDLSMEY